MKNLLILMTTLIGTVCMAEQVQFKVTFDGQFNKYDHYVRNFPTNPHFSPLVIASHNGHYSMLERGAKATPGLKNVAETGSPVRLQTELKNLENKSVVFDHVTTSGTSGQGQMSGRITVSRSYPLISVVSMIAPSPDWVVGVSGYSLIEDGKFINKRVIPLYAIDAGTDGGVEFTSRNKVKREPIHQLINISGASINNPFGTLTIQRVNP